LGVLTNKGEKINYLALVFVLSIVMGQETR
jgi:hypothetical protein